MSDMVFLRVQCLDFNTFLSIYMFPLGNTIRKQYKCSLLCRRYSIIFANEARCCYLLLLNSEVIMHRNTLSNNNDISTLDDITGFQQGHNEFSIVFSKSVIFDRVLSFNSQQISRATFICVILQKNQSTHLLYLLLLLFQSLLSGCKL